MIVAVIILGVILLIGLIIYNTQITKKNQIDNAFSAIDAMLKKRFDLLPNLVEVVKQYMQHEQNVLTRLTELRAQSISTTLAPQEKINIDKQLGKEVSNIVLNAENYPNLKANTNFIQLQTTWTESEEQIAAARRNYNAAVTDYNNSIMMFPGKLVANLFHFQPYTVLSIPEEERKNLKAADLFNGK